MSVWIWRAIEKADERRYSKHDHHRADSFIDRFSAIVSLFLAQAYYLARTSLSRITIFSEALVKNMPIGLIALNDQGKIVTCNEKAQAVWKSLAVMLWANRP